VANKADILGFADDKDIMQMSTETGQGVSEVLDKLVGMLDAMPRYVAPDPDPNEEPMVPSRRT